MKKICKNCKYYEIKTMEKEFGKCYCSKFLNNNDLPWEYERDKDTLLYWDFECYSCGFDVGEEFGCIHFENKQEKREETLDEINNLEKEVL